MPKESFQYSKKTMIIREKDRMLILQIAQKTLRTALEIWAYGSRVTGQAHPCSDLDLVIRTKGLRALDMEQLYAFREALEASNIPFMVEVFDWVGLPDSFHKNISEHHILFLKINSK